MPIITLFESVEFAIVSATISVDLGILVSVEDPTHGPFAIHEARVADLEVDIGLTARASDSIHLFLDRVDTETTVDDHKLFESRAFCVLTIAKPGEAVAYLAIPWRVLLPIDFLDILNGVKSKIDPEGDLKTLRLIRIHTC